MSTKSHVLHVLLPSLVISILMFIALFDNPYGYYEFLRFATLLLAGYVAYRIYEYDENSKFIWAFVAIAIVFNPFLPIYLDRGAWFIVDIVVAVAAPMLALKVGEGVKKS